MRDSASPTGDAPPSGVLRGLLSCGLPLCLLLFCSVGHAAAQSYVNQLRQAAGMMALAWNSELADAAQAHADYLAANPIPESSFHGGSAHREAAGLPGFSGAAPAERALAQGYPHRQVSENVSSGGKDSSAAVDGLMSAIYHRFGFLNFGVDEMGAAQNDHQYVFLMGRGDLRDLCWSPPPQVIAQQPVKCGDSVVTETFMQALCDDLPTAALQRQPWPTACSNGQLLDNEAMRRYCEQGFPAQARLHGRGRFYPLCDPPVKVGATWFDAFCAAPPEAATYRQSGRYYEMCDPPAKVDAQWLERRCAAAGADGRYRESGKYYTPCVDESLRVRARSMVSMRRTLQRRNADVVMWPPDQATHIPPAFFEEDPDPLPDYSVSGYPISIQFNPATTTKVELATFRLFAWTGNGLEFSWKEVTDTRVLDQHSDPHKVFSALQFALFPLQRLQWATRYRAEVEGWVDGEYRQYGWEFQTTDPGGPLFTIDAVDQHIRVDRVERPLLYFPPRREAYSVNGLRAEWRGDTRVEMSNIDGDTARLTIDWRNCEPVKVTQDDVRSVTIARRDCR